MLINRFDTRRHQTATLLPDGVVLVAGGIGHRGDTLAPLASAEAFKP